jgi:hypothetical protein
MIDCPTLDSSTKYRAHKHDATISSSCSSSSSSCSSSCSSSSFSSHYHNTQHEPRQTTNLLFLCCVVGSLCKVPSVVEELSPSDREQSTKPTTPTNNKPCYDTNNDRAKREGNSNKKQQQQEQEQEAKRKNGRERWRSSYAPVANYSKSGKVQNSLLPPLVNQPCAYGRRFCTWLKLLLVYFLVR